MKGEFGDDGDINGFGQPSPKASWRSSDYSGILIYPPTSTNHSIRPIPHTPPRYPARTQAKLFTPPTQNQQRPLSPFVAITGLKYSSPPASPISPLLAAPPKTHFSSLGSPASPFSVVSYVWSSSSGESGGYEFMGKRGVSWGGRRKLGSPFSTGRGGRRAGYGTPYATAGLTIGGD